MNSIETGERVKSRLQSSPPQTSRRLSRGLFLFNLNRTVHEFLSDSRNEGLCSFVVHEVFRARKSFLHLGKGVTG